MKNLFCCLILLALAACQPAQAQNRIAATLPATPTGVVVLATTRAPTLPPTNTPSPQPSDTSAPTRTPRPPAVSATPTPFALATNTVRPSPAPSQTPTITPTLPRIDHYALARPIASSGIDYLDRTYSYGDTQRGARSIHLGVDFANPRGTPVLAAADGTVYYAGSDSARLFGPQLVYYGNVVVIQHNFFSPEGLPVFTLYGHLQSTAVTTSQTVTQGEQIGIVGDTGVAIGSHLHFEVRIGTTPDDWRTTRNPDLWIYPYPSFGTLAGRVTNNGAVVFGQALTIRPLDGGSTRYAFTYADLTVNPDAVFGENFTYGDLPEGQYEVTVSSEGGRIRFRQTITIERGRTTWLDIALQP
ncbi:MAG: peptidoglycan DD-metalloendopeptidase family protein [Chloroflexi bacterium]|nr:peptidoglycan DD-metalloendopeptidase family protein [Chloroflexota bacterium]